MSLNFARAFIIACGAITATSVCAESGSAGVQLEAGASREILDKGYANWSSHYIEGEKKLDEREVVHAQLRKTERFNRQDDEITASYTRPLNEQWSLQLEGTSSPTHLILPKYAFLGQVQYAWTDGWSVYGGMRHTEYTASSVNVGVLTAERYAGDYRFAYSLYTAWLAGAEAVNSHRVQATRFYSDKSWVGLSLSGGQELENLGGGLVQKSDVQSLVFNGRHWLDADWALSYEMLLHQQGTYYTRQGFRVGLRRQF